MAVRAENFALLKLLLKTLTVEFNQLRNLDNWFIQFGVKFQFNKGIWLTPTTRTVAVGLDNPTFEDQRRWLEILQTTVTITSRVAVI